MASPPSPAVAAAPKTLAPRFVECQFTAPLPGGSPYRLRPVAGCKRYGPAHVERPVRRGRSRRARTTSRAARGRGGGGSRRPGRRDRLGGGGGGPRGEGGEGRGGDSG